MTDAERYHKHGPSSDPYDVEQRAMREPCRPTDSPPYEPGPHPFACRGESGACEVPGCGWTHDSPIHEPEPGIPVSVEITERGRRMIERQEREQPETPTDAARSRERDDHDAAVDHFAGRLSPFLERVRARTVPPSAFGARAYGR